MANLLDVAPSAELVDVRGTQVEVTGISALGLAHLLARFPELQNLLAGQGSDLSPSDVIELGIKVVSAIIAAGCGMTGSEEAEGIAAELPLETQVDILAAIQRQTMPSGIGPFVAKLQAMGLVVEDSETQQHGSSQSPNGLTDMSHPIPPGAGSPVM